MKSLLPIITALLLPLAGLHAQPLNILFFTADDMNYDSPGVCGGPIKDLTPHLDQLAAEGLRFEYAYSTVAVCQPVRQTMQCGLYPHRSGSMGFFPIKPEVRTLNQQLHDAGYLISMFGKGKHHQPTEKFCVDVADDTISRKPSLLAEATRKVLRMAREQKRPFFHNVNCYDPHRPFIGMKGPDDLAEGEEPSRRIKPEEITGVPGFLEDLPDIRRELAGYYTNVRRLDDAVGAVLAVLKQEGFADNTLVIFYGGDHGMSFPFGKSNIYENSSRGALIMRWPRVTKAGTVDRDHLVSTLDFAPTLLEAAQLPAIPGIDGRSFLPVVKGGRLEGWDRVFTCYNAAFGSNWLPMRCMRTKNRSYIWNAWSDGKRQYQTENMAGLTWKAMLAAADGNPEIKARTRFYLHRVPEEFYEMSNDRYERENLIADPTRQAEIETMRKELLALMKRTGDPFAEAFAKRDDKELVPAVLEKLKKEYSRSGKAEN
jgi:N-sulfoglucosamine sulfohydrolase